MRISWPLKCALSIVALALMAAPVSARPDPVKVKPANPADKGTTGTNPADPMADPMMQAMMKAGTPGAPHKKLAEMAGNWNLTVKSEGMPGQPPVVEKGTSTMKMIDDRYLHQEVRSSMMGMPFHGIGVTGYDNTTKKYVNTWMDSMSTGIMMSEGTMSADHKTLTLSGSYADPMTGKMQTARSLTTFLGPDKHTFEMWGPGPDGKEMKMMEITYERVK